MYVWIIFVIIILILIFVNVKFCLSTVFYLFIIIFYVNTKYIANYYDYTITVPVTCMNKSLATTRKDQGLILKPFGNEERNEKE